MSHEQDYYVSTHLIVDGKATVQLEQFNPKSGLVVDEDEDQEPLQVAVKVYKDTTLVYEMALEADAIEVNIEEPTTKPTRMLDLLTRLDVESTDNRDQNTTWLMIKSTKPTYVDVDPIALFLNMMENLNNEDRFNIMQQIEEDVQGMYEVNEG